MNHEWTLARLDAYLDDALPATERREVESHLAACEQCRDELASIGALLDTAHDLRARSREPGPDLWPGIAARIQTTGTKPQSADSRSLLRTPASPRRQGWPLSWRWALVTVGTAALFIVALRFGPRLAGVDAVAPGGTVPSGPVRLAAAPLEETADGLAAEVSRVRASLEQSATADSIASGDAWSVFDQNLVVLDGAIKDARTALDRDPDNPVIQRSLLTAYQKQLDLLRWASRVVRQS